MSLLTMPPEVLDIIFKDLDTGSFYSIYNTCKHLRTIISCGVVKKIHFSEDETHLLKSSFFNDIARCLRVLDLSGLYELDLPSLIEALKDTKNLIDLDVRETDITMLDFFEIVKVTSLTSIGINFCFKKKDSEWKLTEDKLLEYQQAFEGFKNVNFTGGTSTIYKKMAVCMLEKADLCDLTLTCSGTIDLNDADCGVMDVRWETRKIRFSKLQAHFINDDCNAGTELPIFNSMDINEYEIFIFGYDYQSGKHMINATPLVEKIMCDILDKEGVSGTVVEVEVLTEYPVFPSFYSELQVRLKRWLFTNDLEDVFIVCWDRERTKFDCKFSAKLLSIYLQLAEDHNCSYDSDSDFYYCY